MAALTVDDFLNASKTQAASGRALTVDDFLNASKPAAEAPAAPSDSFLSGRFSPLSNPLPALGGILEGIGGGAAGTPGDVESMVRSGVAYAPSVGAIAGYGEAGLPVPDEVLAGLKDVKVSKNLLPTSGDIERKLPGSGDTEVEAGRRLGELVSPLAIGKALKVGEGAVNLAGRTVRSALGAETKASAEALRGGVRSQLAGAAGSEAAGAGAADVAGQARTAESASKIAAVEQQSLFRRAESARKLAAVERAQQQIAQRDAVRMAQARDTGQVSQDPLKIPEVGAKAGVVDKFYAQVAEAERHAQEAGLTAEQAQDFAIEQQQKVVEAEAAAGKVDEELAARPQMTSVELGGKIQTAAKEIQKRLVAERAEKSGFNKITDAEARPEPNIPTQSIKDYIESTKKYLASGTRTVLDHFLGDLDTSITQGEKTIDIARVPLARAESVRKELDTAIRSKEITLTGANAGAKVSTTEALHYLRKIRSMLVKSAGDVHPDYLPALSKFRELSRPLDLFDRGGALGDVIAQDNLSDEFKLLQGDVVGRVLKRANAGSPVLARLVKENPQLMEAAKLYFNRELFATTKAPTAAKLQEFLQDNENALRQLGLYDEFSTVEGAKRSVEGTVAAARAEAEQAAATAKDAGLLQKTAEAETKRPAGMLEKATERERAAREALPTRGETADAAAARAAEASDRLQAAKVEAEKGAAGQTKEDAALVKEQAKLTKAHDDLVKGQTEEQALAAKKISDFEARIIEFDSLPADKVASKATTLAESLRKGNYISNDQYKELVDHIRVVQKQQGDTARARTTIKALLIASALAGGGFYLERFVRPLVPF